MLRHLAHFAILASAVGAAVIAVPVSGVQLSLFRALTAIMAFIAVTESLNRGKLRDVNQTGFSYPHYFMLAWLGASILSIAWVRDLGGWAQGTFFIFIATASILLYTLAYSRTFDILRAMGLMSCMALLHNLIGWYETITGNFLFFEAATEIYANNRFAASTFANTNNFATYLVVSLAPLLITLKHTKLRLVKLTMLLGILSTTTLIISSGSRANIIALILWIAAYLVMSFARGRRTIITIAILGIAGGLSLLIQRAPANTSGPGVLSFDFGGGRNSEGIRANLIRNGLHFLRETFGIGVGAGNAEYWMENYAVHPVWGIVNIHNWWVEILVNFGILIFVGYVIMYAMLARRLWVTATRASSNVHRDISGAILCSLAAFAVGSVSASSIVSSEWLWVFFGVTIAFTFKVVSPESTPPAVESGA